jgi:hypothetical protein
MYQPYPQAKFESLNRDWWFQELAQHICLQAESPPFVTDLTRVAALPSEARTIYFLWMFECEAGGSGIEVFLLEPHGVFTPQVHEALRLVGASELVERLEAGIPHALASGSAEFSASSDLAWFRQFHASPKFPTLQSVDAGISNLVGDSLRDKANAFIEAQKGVLVA